MKGLFVSPSPHRSSNASTARIMLMVIISLVPAAAAGCVFFGPRAALVLAMCIACCIIFEALCRIVMKREQTVG
ncbi:MAG: RnfABCDGE type electron transport complex subunit D, partial [Oscillospiraceae bacterium]|nr:RnfABCDGE type electron transport complex subunit D [Oscillospiraceae bacterium]